MAIAATVSHVVLAGALVYSVVRKLGRRADVIESYRHAGVPEEWLPALAAVLIVGACGLVAGVIVAPLSIAASAGLVVYFLLAVVAHLRAGDRVHVGTPVVMALLSAAALILRVASL